MGYSKGAEAALLLGAQRSDLAAIVAGALTNVSWTTLDFIGVLIGRISSFSYDGKAQVDAWLRVIAFLRDSFGGTPAKDAGYSISDGQLKVPRRARPMH
jgi:hypothetical protein